MLVGGIYATCLAANVYGYIHCWLQRGVGEVQLGHKLGQETIQCTATSLPWPGLFKYAQLYCSRACLAPLTCNCCAGSCLYLWLAWGEMVCFRGLLSVHMTRTSNFVPP